jgi:cell division protein FtsB
MGQLNYQRFDSFDSGPKRVHINRSKYFFALWMVIAVNSIGSIIAGPRGIAALRFLENERKNLSTNLDDLMEINRSLLGTMDALRYDTDTIMVQARELGYGEKDEHFFRITSLPLSPKSRMTAGVLLKGQKPVTISIKYIRTVAFGAGLLVLLIFLVHDEFLRKKYALNPRYAQAFSD